MKLDNQFEIMPFQIFTTIVQRPSPGYILHRDEEEDGDKDEDGEWDEEEEWDEW